MQKTRILTYCLFPVFMMLGIVLNAQCPPGSSTIASRINQSSDDAEENGGSMDLSSGDLEMVDNGGLQTVGMRFRNLNIPNGATITSAHIEFYAEQNDASVTNLLIHGEDTDNAVTFTSTSNNITGRTTTSATVNWPNVPSWSVNNTYNSPDISSIIQEIVDRAGWVAGNDLAIIVDGTNGRRSSMSYDQNTSNAPLISVTYANPTAPEICGNSIDDDCDGLTDCDDPDCGVFQLDFNNGQAATYVWGQPNFTSGSSGLSSTKMDNPTCIIEDPSTGKVFVGEYNNYRVLRFSSVEDLLNGIPAEAVLGQPDFVTQNIATTQNGMSSVAGLAINSSGALFVADFGNRRILRFDNAAFKANGANADGVLGQPDFVTALPNLSQNGLNRPYGIFLEDDGTLWTTDFDNWRVLRYDNAAAKANGANADGVLGAPDFTTKTDLPVSTRLRRPLGLTVYQGTVFVSDIFRYRILGWDDAKNKADGASPDRVLGQPDFTSTTHSISQSSTGYVHAMSADEEGNLYVSDGTDDRVTIYYDVLNKANGANADRVLGQPDFVTTGSGLSATALNNPEGSMVFESGGNEYFALTEYWNDRIMIWTLSLSTDELTAASSVLHANDLAGTGSLTFTIVTQPSTGTVAIDNASTGAFTYTPDGPCSVDEDTILTFTYQVTNGNSCSTNGVLEIHLSDAAVCEEICDNSVDDDWDGRTDEPYPANVSENCILWLKADQGFGGGFWLDQSREGNDATIFGNPTQVSNSLNFNDGINFDGDDHVEVSLPELVFESGTHSVAFFIVYEPSTASSNIGIFGNQSATDLHNFNAYDGGWSRGTTSVSQLFIYGIRPHLGTWVLDEEDNIGGGPFESNYWREGISGSTTTFNETSAADVNPIFHIGKSGSHASSLFFQGDIHEVIMYYENNGSEAITDTEREKIQSYLAIKYGIALNHDYTDSQ